VRPNHDVAPDRAAILVSRDTMPLQAARQVNAVVRPMSKAIELMCSKKRCLALCVLIGSTLLGLFVLSILPQSGVTKANFESVTIGMTKAEVESIFRLKATISWQNLCGGKGPITAPHSESKWEGAGTAIIGFGEDERVVAKDWTDKSILERIRAIIRPESEEATFTTVRQ
jgi:hypothetical protein